EDVGPQERVGLDQRAIHVRFGRKIDDRVGAAQHVEQDDQHAIGRWYVPDVRLSRVDVERLDDPRLDLAVVDLMDGEVAERLGAPGAETDELGEVAAVVAEALEIDELDAVDRLRWRVGLQLEGALGLGTQIHPVTTSGEDSRSRLGL